MTMNSISRSHKSLPLCILTGNGEKTHGNDDVLFCINSEIVKLSFEQNHFLKKSVTIPLNGFVWVLASSGSLEQELEPSSQLVSPGCSQCPVAQ